MIKREAQFEKDLEMVAPLCNCYYKKIKDTRSINASNRNTHREVKRACDGIISTPQWNWACECKIGYAKLKPHQKEYQDKVNSINGRFVVLRKVYLKNKIEYRIETGFGSWKTDDLKTIFEVLSWKHYGGE